jgi:hypothetical protein
MKDSLMGTSLKVELLESAKAHRYQIRQNGEPARRIQNATLSTVFSSLRRWFVRQRKKSMGGGPDSY